MGKIKAQSRFFYACLIGFLRFTKSMHQTAFFTW